MPNTDYFLVDTINEQASRESKFITDMSISPASPDQLHQLAQSAMFNSMLANPASPQYQPAKELLLSVIKRSNLLNQDKSSKRTAFSLAVAEDHRTTVNEMLSIMKTFKGEPFIKQLFMNSDGDGNTALHHAVNTMNDNLIKEILLRDKYRQIFFQPNKQGLFSIALALKNYKENRAVLPLSIINQLYFSLENHQHRTRAAEEEISMDPWFFSQPIWRHVLNMCAMRDNDGNIKNIDLNLWDFIIQVINNDLIVLGLFVSKDLIYKHSDSYGNTPGKMLKLADEKRLVGLAGRTISQAGTNTTLAKNKKFMQLAQLGDADYSLWFITNNNSLSMNDLLRSDSANLPKNAMMALVGENLFYVEPHDESKPRSFKQIVFNELSENEKNRFSSLRDFITNHMKPGQQQNAPDNVAVDIIRLIPLMKTNKVQEKTGVPIRNTRGIGMTFLGRSYTTNFSGKDETPQVSTSNKPGYS